MLLPYWFGDNGRQSGVLKYVPIILSKIEHVPLIMENDCLY